MLQSPNNQNRPLSAVHAPLLKNQRECEKAFIQAMHHAGLMFNGAIMADGAIHRFSAGNKSHKDGWYVFHGMAGVFGDWSRDIHEKWSLNNNQLSYQDKESLRDTLIFSFIT